MSKRKYTYRLEVEFMGGWTPIVKEETRDYCLGYLGCHKQCPGPRLAARVVRSDGKVLEASSAEERAPLGMVAGFPTAEQYEAAAQGALERAAAVRSHEAHRVARRLGTLPKADLERASRGGHVSAITRDWVPQLVKVTTEDPLSATLTKLGEAVLKVVREQG
jgi:hypothetical protein